MNTNTYTSSEDDDNHLGYHNSNHPNNNRMRLPPAWLTRRIIGNALQNLTENFAVYFTEIKNGRLSPCKEIKPFVNDVAEVLRGTIQDRNLYLSPSAYPMANKILLDCNDFDTLQLLLNHTLYKPEVNTTRLYDFALKNLLKENPSQKNIDVILSFISDIVKASIPQYSSSLLVEAMERLTISKIKINSNSLLNNDYPLLLPLLNKYNILDYNYDVNNNIDDDNNDNTHDDDNISSSNKDNGNNKYNNNSNDKKKSRSILEYSNNSNDNKKNRSILEYSNNINDNMIGRIPKRGTDLNEIVRASLLFHLFVEGRKLIPGSLPPRAYTLVALACKKANLSTLMLNLYRISKEDNRDDRMLRNIIIFTLARSKEYWYIAIEILNDMKNMNLGVPDIYMYHSALKACDSGKDWKLALILLNEMQKDDHKLTTISLTSAITACAACGRDTEALQLLHLMEVHNISRTVWTYNAAISACAKKSNWKGALTVFEKMRENSLELKVQDVSSVKTIEIKLISIENILSSKERDNNITNIIEMIKESMNKLDEAVEVEEEDEGEGEEELEEEDEEEVDEEEEEEVDVGDEEEEEEEEEEGWDERLNANFDVSFGTGDYETKRSNIISEDEEEVGLFHAMRGVANQVTYNTLIEALGQGGQFILVDELYKEAIENGIVSPLSNIKKGWIDLHGHSVQMAKAAIRYSFEYLLTLKSSDFYVHNKIENNIIFSIDPYEKMESVDLNILSENFGTNRGNNNDNNNNNNSYNNNNNDNNDNDNNNNDNDNNNDKSINDNNSDGKIKTKKRALAIIVGKGNILVTEIKRQLLTEFHPSIRSSISKTNSGRLLLVENDVSNWISIHKSLR